MFWLVTVTVLQCEIHTHTNTQPFYGSMDFVRDNPGKPVPEETFTHFHLSWSSIIPYLLHPSIMIHGILPVQSMHLTVFFHNLSPYISSPNQCLLFATHAHTIATCFAVVPRLCHLILISLSVRNTLIRNQWNSRANTLSLWQVECHLLETNGVVYS